MKVFGVLKSAHRVSYELYKGPLGNLHVLHKCDNPGCVNPEHLFLGTHKENQEDKARKGRGVGHSMPGEAHPGSKLTAEQVLSIFYAAGKHPAVATQFQVSPTLVWKIKNKRCWKHILNKA